MSHPVPGQSYYCEDCYELLEEVHNCIHLAN